MQNVMIKFAKHIQCVITLESRSTTIGDVTDVTRRTASDQSASKYHIDNGTGYIENSGTTTVIVITTAFWVNVLTSLPFF